MRWQKIQYFNKAYLNLSSCGHVGDNWSVTNFWAFYFITFQFRTRKFVAQSNHSHGMLQTGKENVY